MTLQIPVSANSLGIELAYTDERAVVTLTGELDMAGAPRLVEQFAGLARQGINKVALEMSKLQFMDSSGLSVIVAEHNRAKSSGGGLVILSPTRQVIRLFQLSGLMSYLVVQPRMSI